MARKVPRKRGRSFMLLMFLIWVPTVIGALGIGSVADKFVPGAIVGAVIGFVIGLGLAAFPNLDGDSGDDHDTPFPL